MSLFQTSVLDLKEKASSLASSTVKKDSRLKSLEISLEQRREECVKLENQLKKVGANDFQHQIGPVVFVYFGLEVDEMRRCNSLEKLELVSEIMNCFSLTHVSSSAFGPTQVNRK